MKPTPLLCQHDDCRRVLAVLPGRWRIVRAVDRGERVDEGRGVLECRVERDRRGRSVGGCGTRWEVVPAEMIRPVLKAA